MQMVVGTAYSASAYSSDEEYFQDLAAAYAAEWQILYDAGLRSIQIDDPCLLFFVSEEFRSGCLTDGVDPDALLDQYIWAHNLCLAGKPKDLHVGIHLCRGNMAGSTHIMSGSYEHIAERIFSRLNYDTYYLEYDTERAGDFQPLRHLPIGKNVVLGVVSTKKPDLEDIEEMVARVYAAAEIIARGQNRTVADVLHTSLGVSPQCGFTSMSQGGGEGMSMDLMWKKLVLVKELAHRIWGDNQGA
jgi:methionine synthase II (cobalamin-independent)